VLLLVPLFRESAMSEKPDKQRPRSPLVAAPGRPASNGTIRSADDSRRLNQVGCRQVFWLPGLPSAAPSHPDHASEQWHLAAVVAGYSGASAADFHGLPCWPAVALWRRRDLQRTAL
jgi:hypothetical protein